MSNPSLVPNIPYIQDMFPRVANYFFHGSAAANYFYGIYGVYSGSYLDMLHSVGPYSRQVSTARPAPAPPNSAATHSSLRKAARCPLG